MLGLSMEAVGESPYPGTKGPSAQVEGLCLDLYLRILLLMIQTLHDPVHIHIYTHQNTMIPMVLVYKVMQHFHPEQ